MKLDGLMGSLFFQVNSFVKERGRSEAQSRKMRTSTKRAERRPRRAHARHSNSREVEGPLQNNVLRVCKIDMLEAICQAGMGCMCVCWWESKSASACVCVCAKLFWARMSSVSICGGEVVGKREREEERKGMCCLTIRWRGWGRRRGGSFVCVCV